MDTLQNFPKIEKDGKVAVLYSPGYGAGWATWNNTSWTPILTTHRDIVQCVLDGDNDKAAVVAEDLIQKVMNDKDQYICILGAEDLKVEWITKGQSFTIDEYDGYESIEFSDNRSYFTV